MSAAEKIFIPPVSGVSGAKQAGEPMSQSDAFDLIASILCTLNFIASKNRVDSISLQQSLNEELTQSQLEKCTELEKDLKDYANKMKKSDRHSWMKWLNPVTYLNKTVGAITHQKDFSLQSLIATKMNDSFKHMNPVARQFAKIAIGAGALLASMFPGGMSLDMVLFGSGTLSVGATVTAGEDPENLKWQIAGAVLQFTATVAIAIALMVVTIVGSGGTATVPAVEGATAAITAETATAVTSVMAKLVKTISTLMLLVNIMGALFGFDSSRWKFEAAHTLGQSSNVQQSQQLLTSLMTFNTGAIQNIISSTKEFVDEINDDLKNGLRTLLSPLTVTAAG